jgi:hypothetical protein
MAPILRFGTKWWLPFWSCQWKMVICPGQMTICQGQLICLSRTSESPHATPAAILISCRQIDDSSISKSLYHLVPSNRGQSPKSTATTCRTKRAFHVTAIEISARTRLTSGSHCEINTHASILMTSQYLLFVKRKDQSPQVCYMTSWLRILGVIQEVDCLWKMDICQG